MSDTDAFNGFTLNGKAVKEGDTVYSPFHGEGTVTNGFNFTKTVYTFEVLFLRKHWNIYGSHIHVNYPSEPDNLYWEQPITDSAAVCAVAEQIYDKGQV